MEDDTTTGAAPITDGGQEEPQVINGIPVDANGQAIPAPADDEEQAATAADATTTEPGKEQPGGQEETPATPTVDDKLRKYAESQSIELDSPGAIKAAQVAMKAQAEATRNSQKVNQLEKVSTITPEQIVEDATPEQRDNIRTRNVELQLETMRWRQEHADKPEVLAAEGAMADIILNDPKKRLLVQEGYLSLNDLYKLARDDSSAAVRSQGGREALEALAHKQQAAVPRGNAVNGTATTSASALTPQNVDRMVANMSVEEYQKRLPEINKVLSGK
jgi:hypothetical protein